MKTILLSVAATFALGLSAPADAASLLNGSFETGTVTGGFEDLNSASTLLTDWTVGGTVDFIGNYWQASNGNQSLDMNGVSGGSISQTITDLVIGQLYNISFDLSGNPDDADHVKQLSVDVAGVGAQLYSFVTGSNTHSAMGWLTKVYAFTATATSQTLTFASTNPTSSWGPALDNVSISAVPLPAGAPLLFGGLAGLVALRRRKSV